MPKPKTQTQPAISAFLRSINVQLDAEAPDRIAHFRPTAKAIALLEKLCFAPAPAILVTAPYGSGKSLTATYALHLTENTADAGPVLQTLAPRLAEVSTRLSTYAATRARSRNQGITIALQGYANNLRQALCNGFLASTHRLALSKGLPRQIESHLKQEGDVTATAHFLLAKAKELGLDQVVILWDEFGRHLESLIANGRPSELHDVQQLAELTVRSRKVPMKLCVLLHQGFGAYAASVPDIVRREWRKIEERFERLEYVDDSKELIRLLVDLAESLRPSTIKLPAAKEVQNQARALLATGLFKDFTATDLTKILERVYPLEGAALYLLPRLSARVAQNERTLFNFLQAADWTQPISTDALYRYFEPAMRQDVGTGGTYRAMLETTSATSKCRSENEARVIQTACVLSIGLSAHKTKISRQLLLTAAGTSAGVNDSAERVVDGLIERKLLLYRRHSDEVSVWHGTDANLRERVAEARTTIAVGFKLGEFLAREWPLPAIRATEHNDRFQMRRYFTRQYRTTTDLAADNFATTLTGVLVDSDGLILHALPTGDQSSRDDLIVLAQSLSKAGKGRIIVSVPAEHVPLEQAAIELAAIMRLQKDRALLDEDPLVAEELRQMEDDSRTHMLRLIERVTQPNRSLKFFVNGRMVGVDSLGELRHVVSDVCNRAFPKTPRLPNEQVNRRRPSAVIVNARKKLLAAVLEASGKPDLGFGDPQFQRELGAAVVAQFRATIRNPGLYRDLGKGRWGFAAPSALADEGLAAVWAELRRFFTEPSETPKPITTLLQTMQAAPFGVRAGVLPILIGCAVRAFPTVGSLTMDGQYVSDIRPSTVEDLCREPQRFALNVLAVEDDQREYLEGICDLFRGKRTATIDDPDLVRRAFEWIQYWKQEAPEAVRVSGSVSQRAAAARKVLWSTEDPIVVLLQQLPAALGTDARHLPQALKQLVQVKQELDDVVQKYVSDALRGMTASIGESHDPDNLNTGARALRTWAEAISETALDRVLEPRAKGVVSQLAQPSDNPGKFVNMITARLTKAVTRWDDTDAAKFQQEFRRIIELVEEAAFQVAATGQQVDAASRERLAALIERRIAHHAGMLAAIVGKKDAQSRLRRSLHTTQHVEEGLFHE
jgi:hypothetical protein